MSTALSQLEFAKAFNPSGEAAFRKSVDESSMTVRSVLTYPRDDSDGDFVHPSGCEFDPLPYVNYEHDPAAIIGTGSVQWGKLPDGVRVPIGTTKFNQSGKNARLALQAFDLVRRDYLPGVSMEYLPKPGGIHDRGFKSLRLNRPAYEFTNVLVKGWAHCHMPVNESAVVLKSLDVARSILGTGKLAGEELHPIIRKSLTSLVSNNPRSTAVVGGWSKSMDAPADMPLDSTMDNADMDMDAGAVKPKPTAMAGMTAVQGIKDLIGQVRQMLESCEHEKGIECLEKFLDSITSEVDELANDLKGIFSATGDKSMEPADEGDDEVTEEDDPLPETEDGAIKTKAFPKGFPRRWKLADVQFETVNKSVDSSEDRKKVRELQKALKELKREYRALCPKA